MIEVALMSLLLSDLPPAVASWAASNPGHEFLGYKEHSLHFTGLTLYRIKSPTGPDDVIDASGAPRNFIDEMSKERDARRQAIGAWSPELVDALQYLRADDIVLVSIWPMASWPDTPVLPLEYDPMWEDGNRAAVTDWVSRANRLVTDVLNSMEPRPEILFVNPTAPVVYARATKLQLLQLQFNSTIDLIAPESALATNFGALVTGVAPMLIMRRA